jgi:hypothetical protein
MKQYILLIYGLVILSFTSCNDWFDVTSGSEIREEDHYSSATGFQQSLIGCYLGMADETLYGRNLSWNLIELIGNQYELLPLTSASSMEYRLQQYNYGHSEVVGTIESIWAKAYSVIANANKALYFIDKNKSILHEIDYQIIKGELLAIRAYMHFDLLRLYGYGNWEERAAELNNKLTIPYVVDIMKEPTPQRSGKETIEMILADLDEASSLLKDYDPVTGKHPASYYREVNEDGFMNNRNIRLNYYAIKGLQARVLMWEGSAASKTKALAAAEEVITAVEKEIRSDDMSTYLYMLSASDVTRSTSSLATEHLFGLNVPNLATKMASYINPTYRDTDYAAFYLSQSDAVGLYENSTSDVRYSVLLSQNTSSSTMGFVPLKYYQANQAYFYSNKVSMIRIPEMYYIAAECYASANNPNLAMNRLNTVRNLRGLYQNLENLTTEEIFDEIKREYHKEFISEGVMFYYYKRTGATSVPHYPEQMGDEEYVLPYPAFELQAGRVQ